MAKDPVCGMEVPEATAAHQASHEEKTYSFCSGSCRSVFMQSPEQFAHGGDEESAPPKR